MPSKTDIAFLFIGGPHQVAHLAPVAAEIARQRPDVVVQCICADDETESALREVRRQMVAPRLAIVQIPTPRIGQLLVRLTGRQSARKGPILAAIRWRARRTAMLVVPERTSAALRRMGWRRPLVHFRHGAGDRAPRSDRRLTAFDLIVVAGDKDRERAVRLGVDPDRVRAIGYVKLDYLTRLTVDPPRLFANARPVVLYNPHFDPAISSLGIARDVIARFAAQGGYNLIYAPHVRAAENMTAAERADWAALAVPDRIIVDLGSPRLFDMTYTRAADLYLGDMSSQLYEFLARPRPMTFINAHDADWRDDPRYAGWQLGTIAHGAGDVLAAVDAALTGHAAMAERQREAVVRAFGDYTGAIGRGAALLLDALSAREP